MSEQEFKFDKETLMAQRRARNIVKRNARILAVVFVAGVVLLFALSRIYSPAASFVIVLFLPLLFGSNWIQWNALITQELRCPHCGQRLAEHVNLFFSPSPKRCRCGEVALASIWQLQQKDEDADEDKNR